MPGAGRPGAGPEPLRGGAAGPEAGPWGRECLHHPEALLEVLLARQQGRVLLHGHLHTEMHVQAGAAALYCTPSTCHQTKQAPPSGKWEVADDELPGYRVVRLHPDGAHSTTVVRVDIADLYL